MRRRAAKLDNELDIEYRVGVIIPVALRLVVFLSPFPSFPHYSVSDFVHPDSWFWARSFSSWVHGQPLTH